MKDSVSKENQSAEEIFYRIGKIIFPILVVGWIIVFIMSNRIINNGIGCMIYRAIGIYCPGCGATRAVCYLSKGHLLLSLYYNPTILYFLAVYLFFMANRWLYRKSWLRIGKPMSILAWLYGGIVLMLLQCIIKNILLIGFHIHLI